MRVINLTKSASMLEFLILIGCLEQWYEQADVHEASSSAEIQEREPEYYRMVTAVLTQAHYDFYNK